MRSKPIMFLAVLVVAFAALAQAPTASAQVAVSGTFGLPHGVVSFGVGHPAYGYGYGYAPVYHRHYRPRVYTYVAPAYAYRPYVRHVYRSYYRPYYRPYSRVYVQPYAYGPYCD